MCNDFSELHTDRNFYYIGLLFHSMLKKKFVWLDGSSDISYLYPWYGNSKLNQSCAGIWATAQSKISFPKGLKSIHTDSFECDKKFDFICERAGWFTLSE